MRMRSSSEQKGQDRGGEGALASQEDSTPVPRAHGAEKPQAATDSAWVLLTNLSSRASWNKVRALFSDIGCTVLSGKVKRATHIAVVRLSSADDAIKAVAELSGKTFNDIPDAPIQARQMAESERSTYET